VTSGTLFSILRTLTLRWPSFIASECIGRPEDGLTT
jgi:hypothetical protein